jgi:FixJ family two-component response regulator
MTGHGDDNLIKEAAEAGAYDFIGKPVNRDVLVLAVTRALEAHYWRKIGKGHPSTTDSLLRVEGLPPSCSIIRLKE